MPRSSALRRTCQCTDQRGRKRNSLHGQGARSKNAQSKMPKDDDMNSDRCNLMPRSRDEKAQRVSRQFSLPTPFNASEVSVRSQRARSLIHGERTPRGRHLLSRPFVPSSPLARMVIRPPAKTSEIGLPVSHLRIKNRPTVQSEIVVFRRFVKPTMK